MQSQFQRSATWLSASPSRERAGRIALNLIEGVVIACLAWQVAQFGWTVVTPVTMLGGWQPQAQTSATTDRSVMGSFDPFFRSAVDDGGTVSNLSLVLAGTRADSVSGRGSAIIATQDGVQASFAVGDIIQPGVTLAAVGFDSVTITRDGVSEKLFIDQSAGGAPTASDGTTMASASPRIGGNAAAAGALAADVTVTPRLQNGSLTGYVLTPKGSGTAFAAAGLQPGDVLVSVDGATVTSLKDVAGLTQQLAAGGIEISVERGGQRVNFRIGSK